MVIYRLTKHLVTMHWDNRFHFNINIVLSVYTRTSFHLTYWNNINKKVQKQLNAKDCKKQEKL